MGTADAEVGQVTQEYQRYFTDKQTSALSVGWAKAETPQHWVMVAGFFIGRFEVTQAQWRAVALLPEKDRYLDPNPSNFEGDNLPVERVSWEDATEFCKRLSRNKPGRSYRLASEAEWEYACRAGTATAFTFGETITPELVNYNGNYPYSGASKGTDLQRTTPVGSFKVANGFGLYDMHGNVWEWCLDTWHENYYGGPQDGSAWVTGGESRRVLRGGAWYSDARYCRSARRGRNPPDLHGSHIGFRVVVAGT
jgi:formylglycine-generating enzyme required for sulfatase activity